MFPAVHNKCKSEQVKFSYKTASRKHEDTLSTFMLVCSYMYMPVCTWIIRLGGGCIYPLSHLTAWNIPQKYDWSKAYVKPGFLFIFCFFFLIESERKKSCSAGLGPRAFCSLSKYSPTDVPAWAFIVSVPLLRTDSFASRLLTKSCWCLSAFAVGMNVFSEWSPEGLALWWNWSAWKGL